MKDVLAANEKWTRTRNSTAQHCRAHHQWCFGMFIHLAHICQCSVFNVMCYGLSLSLLLFFLGILLVLSSSSSSPPPPTPFSSLIFRFYSPLTRASTITHTHTFYVNKKINFPSFITFSIIFFFFGSVIRVICGVYYIYTFHTQYGFFLFSLKRKSETRKKNHFTCWILKKKIEQKIHAQMEEIWRERKKMNLEHSTHISIVCGWIFA